MKNNNYCVIMGGGVGSRFWPMSREHKPKQFIDVFGTGLSLLQMTYKRFARFIPKDQILVVTNRAYLEQTLEQLPELKPEQVLLEPIRRNTAPCIAYACHHIEALNPEANIVVSPSDHLILNEDAFVDSVQKALDYVTDRDVLVTLGVRPSRPDTGYGYIQMGVEDGESGFHMVRTFTEKPNQSIAEIFLASGEYLWNSGMFIWSNKTIQDAFQVHLPDLASIFKEGKDKFGTEGEQAFIDEIFHLCPKISIDYGVLEKHEKVMVLPVDFGWADLGTWGSVYSLKEKDTCNNVTLGTNACYYDSSGNIVSMGNPESLVVLQGVEDSIVSYSNGVLLVCKRSQEHRIKDFIADATAQFQDKFS